MRRHMSDSRNNNGAATALARFAERRKRTQRPAPAMSKNRVPAPTLLDEFEYLAPTKARSASCTTAVALWPFFF